MEAVEVREERKVILEQWSDFLSIAVETDPQMVSLQGRAFLKTLARLNGRALETIPAGIRLDELQLQWEESEILGKALADLVEAHKSQRSDAPDWRAMYEAMRGLAQGLLDHRDALRKQIAAAGEGVSTE
jgi:hypothetical protein